MSRSITAAIDVVRVALARCDGDGEKRSAPCSKPSGAEALCAKPSGAPASERYKAMRKGNTTACTDCDTRTDGRHAALFEAGDVGGPAPGNRGMTPRCGSTCIA